MHIGPPIVRFLIPAVEARIFPRRWKLFAFIALYPLHLALRGENSTGIIHFICYYIRPTSAAEIGLGLHFSWRFLLLFFDMLISNFMMYRVVMQCSISYFHFWNYLYYRKPLCEIHSLFATLNFGILFFQCNAWRHSVVIGSLWISQLVVRIFSIGTYKRKRKDLQRDIGILLKNFQSWETLRHAEIVW